MFGNTTLTIAHLIPLITGQSNLVLIVGLLQQSAERDLSHH